MRLGRVGRIAGSARVHRAAHRPRDARDDHARPERCRDVPGALECPRRGVGPVVSQNDRLHLFLLRTDVRCTLRPRRGNASACSGTGSVSVHTRQLVRSRSRRAARSYFRRRKCARSGPKTSTSGIALCDDLEKRVHRMRAADTQSLDPNRERAGRAGRLEQLALEILALDVAVADEAPVRGDGSPRR